VFLEMGKTEGGTGGVKVLEGAARGKGRWRDHNRPFEGNPPLQGKEEKFWEKEKYSDKKKNARGQRRQNKKWLQLNRGFRVPQTWEFILKSSEVRLSGKVKLGTAHRQKRVITSGASP